MSVESKLDNSVFCKLVKQDELYCLHINHPKFFAEICLQGAQLTQFVPVNKAKLIWLSSTAEYKIAQGLRGGIPVCWPWFGSMAKNPDIIKKQILGNSFDYETSAHGFVRTLDWSLSGYTESAQGVELALTIQQSTETLKIWPFKFNLNCRFILGNNLEVVLETKNLSNKIMHFAQALHTYLPISDILNTKIIGAEDQSYIDALDDWKVKKQNQSILIKEEVDRIYFGKADYKILTPQQTIRIESDSKSSVIWNPWIEKSKRLTQFSHDDYKTMLCIESANVLDDSVSLAPQDTHILTLKVNQ
ncbi:MAG: glucose-6-phosphate 1-epimerase [Bermanella sp.]|jgi:glucose-6-phosphate 1-epimerase